MNRREYHRAALETLEARSKAFADGEKKEARARGIVNVLAAAWVAIVVAVEWSTLLTGRALMLGLIGWVAVRTFGNAIVSVRVDAHIRRIKEQYPMPDPSQAGGNEP